MSIAKQLYQHCVISFNLWLSAKYSQSNLTTGASEHRGAVSNAGFSNREKAQVLNLLTQSVAF